MTNKRPLNEEERKFTQIAVDKLKEELEYTQYLLKHANLMLEHGLEQNYKLQMRDYKEKKTGVVNDLKSKTSEITRYVDQLNNGVEIKEQPKKEES